MRTVADFVRIFGWDEFKELYQASLYQPMFEAHRTNMFGISNTEIKKVFESLTLVEKFGGLEEAKRIANNPLAIFNTLPLKQAIADVEACQ